jgi:hypothetical protein
LTKRSGNHAGLEKYPGPTADDTSPPAILTLLHKLRAEDAIKLTHIVVPLSGLPLLIFHVQSVFPNLYEQFYLKRLSALYRAYS